MNPRQPIFSPRELGLAFAMVAALATASLASDAFGFARHGFPLASEPAPAAAPGMIAEAQPIAVTNTSASVGG